MAVDVVDDDGSSAGVGRRGELVCRRSFPSMPLGSGATARSARSVPVPGRLLRAHRGPLGPGRLRHLDRARRHGDPRALRHDAQPGRRAHSAPPRSTARSPTYPRSWSRWCSASRSATTCASCCSWCSSPAASSMTSSSPPSVSRIREGTTPPPRAGLVVQVGDLPRTRSGKLAELAVADVVNGRQVRNTTATRQPRRDATSRPRSWLRTDRRRGGLGPGVLAGPAPFAPPAASRPRPTHMSRSNGARSRGGATSSRLHGELRHDRDRRHSARSRRCAATDRPGPRRSPGRTAAASSAARPGCARRVLGLSFRDGESSR